MWNYPYTLHVRLNAGCKIEFQHVKREVIVGGSSPLPFVAQLSPQMINLQLQSSGILLMRKVAPISRLAPASMGGMHTNHLVPSSLKVDKMIFTLGLHKFCLVWTWTYHSCTSNSLKHKNFSQTVLIVKTQFESLA